MAVKGTIPGVSMETVYSRVAGEDIVAYTVVCLDGVVIKKADPLDANRMPVVALVKTATSEGQTVNAWYRGIITNPDWNFTSGQALFLMSGGVIGHNVPEASGNIVQQMGEALTKTSIHFDPEDTSMVIGG